MTQSLSVAIASQKEFERVKKEQDKGEDDVTNHLTKEDVSNVPNQGSSTWKQYYANFMMVWAVVSHVSVLMQSIKIWEGKDASGVSMETYILFLVSSTIWMIYGFFVLNPRNWVIVLSSLTAISINISILIGVIKYGDASVERLTPPKT